MSAHTPGPWHATQPWAGFAEIRDAQNCLVFAVAHPSTVCDDPPMSDEEKQANLTLAALAPELRDSLEEVLKACAAFMRLTAICICADGADIEAEMKESGVVEGFGRRARAVLAKANPAAVRSLAEPQESTPGAQGGTMEILGPLPTSSNPSVLDFFPEKEKDNG